MPVDIGPLVKDWMESDILVGRAATKDLVQPALGICPVAAEAHAILLAPTIKHLGPLPAYLL